jgi:hypothetical protein
MIEPILSLAFSLQSNKGVYALLLGSGISRSAGIPTGWEVTLDLIKKFAYVKKEDPLPDPAQWYKTVMGEEVNYSKVLKLIAKTSSERSRLLRNYFEPTDEERENHQKIPTEAHRAIAKLVSKGYIKVILTTNFDRLLEKALEEEGITPQIISSTDAINGATPLIHSTCTVIKLHGDYLDTRIKNTPEELANYDKKLAKLIGQVFEDFGLIICGWSGDWDVALVNSLNACASHRYTTYWGVKGKLSDTASILANFRKAEIISIESADKFFSELTEKVLAIEEFEKPHPLSILTATSLTKKYLEDDKNRIHLYDLAMGETDKLYENISPKFFSIQEPSSVKDEFLRRVDIFENKLEMLQAIFIVISFWGNRQYICDIVQKSISRLLVANAENNGITNLWTRLQFYPALVLSYSVGVVALSSNNYEMLSSLFGVKATQPAILGKTPIVLSLDIEQIISKTTGQLFPGCDNHKTPVSDHLAEIIKPKVISYFASEVDYEHTFDRFEYLLSLVFSNVNLKFNHNPWMPLGRFFWRSCGTQLDVKKIYQQEIDSQGTDWAPLKFGFFENSLSQVQDAQKEVNERLKFAPMW